MLAVIKRCCAAMSMLLVMIAVPGASLAGDRHETVEVAGTGKYSRLTGRWSNWLQSMPADQNPALDPDGRFCDVNQRGHVWFLAGSFGGALGEPAVPSRECHVPQGWGIFFPVTAFISFAPEFTEIFPDPDCDVITDPAAEARCDVNNDVPVSGQVGLSVVINGDAVGDLFAYRAHSKPGGFTFKLRDDSVFGFLGGGDRVPAVADGYWILLKPLPHGTHTVSFGADFDMDGNRDLGADYTLHVVDDDDSDSHNHRH